LAITTSATDKIKSRINRASGEGSSGEGSGMVRILAMFSNASSIAVSAARRGALAELSGEFIVKLRNRTGGQKDGFACPFERGVGKRRKRGF